MILRPDARMKRVCYFVPVTDRSVLDWSEFYRQDLQILEALGCEVVVATRWSELPWDADLYFAWWWTWAFQPALVATLRRRPLVVTGTLDLQAGLDGQSLDCRPAWQGWLMRWALGRARANVFLTEGERRLVADVEGLEGHYIPSGVDADRYAFGDPDVREPLVFTVAWMHPTNVRRKGLQLIVEAAPYVLAGRPDVRFMIAGDRGEGCEVLVRRATELGVAHAFDFPGVIDEQRKITLMQRCGVYVQPSLHEGFGLAVLEAMSCGAPVVASRGGALPEVIGGAGLTIERPTPRALADAIVGLLGDRSSSAELGRRARDRAVRVFPLDRRGRELGALLRQLLDDPRAVPRRNAPVHAQ
jgi:glycosyltransferase involved in cell wall biosynthesis